MHYFLELSSREDFESVMVWLDDDAHRKQHPMYLEDAIAALGRATLTTAVVEPDTWTMTGKLPDGGFVDDDDSAELHDQLHAAVAVQEMFEEPLTAPTPAVVVAASSGDAEVLRVAGQDIHNCGVNDPVPVKAQRALSRATVLDRAELVAWLQRLEARYEGDDMPPSLRALAGLVVDTFEAAIDREED